jgi:hypothetical protein
MGHMKTTRVMGVFLLGCVLGAFSAFGVNYVQGLDQRLHNVENYLAAVSAGR